MQANPWYEDFFGDDYLRIYAPFLPAARTETEVEHIVTLLGLTHGNTLLDLCCGQGRHAIPLAQRGYKITGLDLSGDLLRVAEENAEHQDLRIRWIHSDMRKIPFTEEFDAIINIFTSFGYLENEDEDQRVLQQVYKALKPGGRFLLETVYQPKVVRAFSPYGIIRYDDGLIVLEERHIDLLNSRNEVHITLLDRNGKRIEYHQSMRIYTLSELKRMLENAGMMLLGYYGGLDQGSLTLDSRLVLLAQRPES